MKHHLFVTDFWIPRKRHSFSFNPKICILIRIDEVLDSVFVTKGGTKNVIFVTIATNRPCNQLIFKYIFRAQKSPWKVLVLLHREVTTSRFFGNILDILKLNHISRILPGQKSAPSPAWFTYPNWLQSILVLPMVLSIFVWECP